MTSEQSPNSTPAEVTCLSLLKKELQEGCHKDIVVVKSLIKKTEDEILLFRTPDEFNQYYQENRLKIDGTSTQALNRMIKVPGYIIRRYKKTITLRPYVDKPNMIENKINELEDTLKVNNIENLWEVVQAMKMEHRKMKQTLQDILDWINIQNESQEL